MKYFDYENGTAYIVLYKGDFVSESRFKAYSDFMNQNGDIIRVPIDSERARNIRIPKTDTQPVVHGEWEDNHTTCSVCGWQMIDDVTESRMMLGFKFCPNCGCTMEDI